MKIRSSLDPVSNKSRINLVFIVGRFLEDLLTVSVMRTVFLYCDLPVSLSFVGFEFTCITVTTAVALPVSFIMLSILEIPFPSNEKALMLVSLIGQGSKNVVKAGCKSGFLNFEFILQQYILFLVITPVTPDPSSYSESDPLLLLSLFWLLVTAVSFTLLAIGLLQLLQLLLDRAKFSSEM